MSRVTQRISAPTEGDSRKNINEPNANGFAGYVGVFEDTRQVVSKIAHRGGTLDIARVAGCTHPAVIDGDNPVVVLPWVNR